MAKYIMAIDQGTTGTTVCIVDEKSQIVSKLGFEYEQIFPNPGWVEHNPEMIWKSVLDAIKGCLEKGNIRPQDIASIGITNQRETTLVWERKSGRPVYNAIVWQCRRTTVFCEKLKQKGKERIIKNKTGLLIDPYFSASKFRWIIDNVAGAREAIKKGLWVGGTIDSFLIWRLSGGRTHKTDVSNASRTQLMNLKTGDWDPELLKLFGIKRELLPEIVPSSGILGVTQGLGVLPDGVPISGVAGDQQAALFGQACFKSGEAKCTFGTGSFLLMNTGDKMLKSKAGLLTTVAWQLEGQKGMTYALEGGAFICGALVQWLRDGLGLIADSSEIEALASEVADSGGVEIVPAFAGLGAPHWDPVARGLISGLTRGTQKSHLARAALEAMALQNVDILRAMEVDLGKKMKSLKVDGGAAANNLLMQLQSNYLKVPIVRPKVTETTVAGAAYLAGLGIGFWSSLKDIQRVWSEERTFSSSMDTKARRLRMESWQQAVKRTRWNKK